MQEIFGSGKGKMQLSSRDIQRMKKNMRKVPIIQEKSDIYHKQDSQKAEEILQDIHSLGNHNHRIITTSEAHIGRKQKLKKFFITLYTFFIPTHTNHD